MWYGMRRGSRKSPPPKCHHVVANFRKPELRVASGDDQITSQAQFEAAPDCIAFDRCDQWLVRGPAENAEAATCQLRALLSTPARLQVCASAKVSPCPSDHANEQAWFAIEQIHRRLHGAR